MIPLTSEFKGIKRFQRLGPFAFQSAAYSLRKDFSNCERRRDLQRFVKDRGQGLGFLKARAFRLRSTRGKTIMRNLFLLFGGLMLAGCASAPPPPPPQKDISEMTPQERCASMVALMGNRRFTTAQQMALYERAKNDGCLGAPQPTTIQIR